jgi:dCTP deaminase
VICSDRTIRKLIAEERLGIDPYDDSLVQPASIDVRLGGQFRVMRNRQATHIDPFVATADLMDVTDIGTEDTFVLHPGEFALGHTVETFRLPDDLVGVVNGKSSLGRLGLLVHATAGFVDPCFAGTLVLELSNVATLPIVLRPGMKVAQMVFQLLDGPAERPYGHPDLNSKYQGQTGATPSRYDRNPSATG